MRTPKSKKNNNKAKLNLAVRDEQRNKLEQRHVYRTVPSPIFWDYGRLRLGAIGRAGGVAHGKMVADAMNLSLDINNPANRKKLRRAVVDLLAAIKLRD